MVNMSDIEQIKELKDKEGLSFREISKLLGIDRKTISKWYKSKSFPKYKRNNQPSPVKDRVIEHIEQWVKEDKKQIKEGKLNKIRSAVKMYDDLVSMGIKCSEPSVRNYLREYKPREVYIEQEYFAGEDMQVDWGELYVDFEGDIRSKVYIFVATLPYSNTRFVCPYIRCDSISFFDGHIKAFEFFGGIPKRIRYDNLTSAVKKVLKGSNREEQDKMIYFKTFFGFETNYCNIAKGNEKGSVENAVKYVKNRFLSTNTVFKDLDNLKIYLFNKCRDVLNSKHYRKNKLIKELLVEEVSKLNNLPNVKYDNSIRLLRKVTSTSTVKYEGVRYSVPSKYCSKRVLVYANIEEIKVYHKEKEIANHKRTYPIFNKEVYNFNHYLPVLIKKSRALPNAKCIVRSNFPPIFNKYLDGLNSRLENGNREMVKILFLNKEYDLKDIFFSMEWCYEYRSFSFDSVSMTLKELTTNKPTVEKIRKAYPEIKEMPLNLKKYDKLLGV